MAGYIRARDPSRPVHYEGAGSKTAATDILCPMYARIPMVRLPPQRALDVPLYGSVVAMLEGTTAEPSLGYSSEHADRGLGQ